MSVNDGGPAFPYVNPNYDSNWDSRPQIGGMTLRDYFAGQAMNKGIINGDWDSSIEWRAVCAYQVADAMLAARGGK